MPRKTLFRDDWLKQKDANGHILQEWCIKNSAYEAFCQFCKKKIKCDNRGLSQLLNHSQTHSHKLIIKDIVKGTQLTFEKPCKNTSAPQVRSDLAEQHKAAICWSVADSKIKAELLWALKIVSSNFSYNSCSDLNELFKEMFPDSSIASKFSAGPTKISYLISEAIWPYFQEILLSDIRNSESPFSICYDELTNKAVKKQLDLKIRYWSNKKKRVLVHHLDTFIMGRATAKDITEKIIKSINERNLLLQNLITLGSDGPNVNKAVFQKVSEYKKEQDFPALIDVGTCTLHIVHNAFGKCVNEFAEEIVDLVIDLHNFFKLSPVRQEEFNKLQDELGVQELKFLKHVQCRWLTLAPAIERIKSQWVVITQYFLKELPKRDKKLSENGRYLRIIKCIKQPSKTLTKCNFLLTLSKLLESYLTIFQSEQPLIYALYDAMSDLVRSVFGRFMKLDELREKSFEDLRNIEFPCRDIEVSDDEIDIGQETRKTLQNLKEQYRTQLLFEMRKGYYVLGKALVNKLPLKNEILSNINCMKPENRCTASSLKSLRCLSKISLVPSIDVDTLTDEWRLLQLEDLPEGFAVNENEPSSKRIDYYWSKIFDIKNNFDQAKFPNLTRFVKALLIIPHGSADVERGFSQTSNFLTENRTSLSEVTINALQCTKDGLKQFNNEVHKVPITRELIKKGLKAHQLYLERLEEEKRIKEKLKKQEEEERAKQKQEIEAIEKKKKELQQKSEKTRELILKEKSLEEKEDKVKENVKIYQAMVEEANDRIKRAIKTLDRKSLQVGQSMLETACKKVELYTTSLEKVRKDQKQIEKTKRTMLDYYNTANNDAKRVKTN